MILTIRLTRDSRARDLTQRKRPMTAHILLLDDDTTAER